MTHSALAWGLGSEFNDFLFAPVGKDKNDMTLSVLSALARLNVDPWQEAAALAQLPRETAAQRLASSIASLPDWSSTHLEYGTIAARLIGLLPRQAEARIPPRGTLLEVGEASKFRAGLFMYAVLLVFMLAGQWFAAGRQPPAEIDGARASDSGKVVSQVPPPNSER
jgi:hypothetical protein